MTLMFKVEPSMMNCSLHLRAKSMVEQIKTILIEVAVDQGIYNVIMDF